jgi:hypothetical protein
MNVTLDASTRTAIVAKAHIETVQDAMDVIADLWATFGDCRSVILRAQDIADGFFDLSTGLAGEILQKYTNYRMRVAIVGDFSKYPSKTLPDFIRECNRGDGVFFVSTQEEALARLGARA